MSYNIGMDIILASNSPRRKELLKKLCNFKVIVSGADENISEQPPEEFCKTLAYLKAQSVAKDNYNSLVIGADTIVVCNDKIIGKPKDEQDNIKILQMLSNNPHYVYTGYALIYKDKSIIGVDKTKVVFNKLSLEQIVSYAKSGLGLDKAGGYGIQDNDIFVKEIIGSFDNVVGLPTEKLKEELQKIKEDIL